MNTPRKRAEFLLNISPRPGRERSDDERRAMFARLRGRGGAPRRAPVQQTTTGPQPPPGFIEYTQDDGTKWYEGIDRPEGFEVRDMPDGRKFDPIYHMLRDGNRWEQPWEPNLVRKLMSNPPDPSISSADSDFLALGLPGATGLMSSIPKIGRYLASWAAPILSTGTSIGIEAYRKEHPELNPTLDHYLALGSTLAGYVAVITGLGTAKKESARVLDSFEFSGNVGARQFSGTALDGLRALGSGIDSLLARAGTRVKSWTPTLLHKPLAAGHKVYSAVADWTGSSIADLVNLPQRLRNPADPEARLALLRAGLVTGGIVARDIYDQSTIRARADEIMSAHYSGESVPRNLSQGRDPLATAAAIAAGTLGNPVEKLLRFGQSEYIDQRAIYLATRDMIDDAESIGYLTPEEAARYRRLASLRKPQNMAGKAAWQFAPAVAAFGNWKMGEQVQDKLLTPTKYVEVAKVLDGDTIEDADGTRYRIQGYDTFETGKRKGEVDEPFAREGEARLMSLVKPGQTVRVRSGTPEGAFMTDKYGRQLAYVETVPQAIAALPGVRRVWPGTDVASKLITEGLAQPRYEELNPAGHARQMRYNALAELAKDVQAGMWSPEGAKTVAEWPHKDLFVYKTFTERRDEAMRRAGIAPAESSRLLDAGMHIGSLGLMTTGNAGLFKYLPRSGNLAAQTWNAALAIGGGLQHNQRADNRPPPKPISKPRYLPDDYDLKLMSVGMQ